MEATSALDAEAGAQEAEASRLAYRVRVLETALKESKVRMSELITEYRQLENLAEQSAKIADLTAARDECFNLETRLERARETHYDKQSEILEAEAAFRDFCKTDTVCRARYAKYAAGVTRCVEMLVEKTGASSRRARRALRDNPGDIERSVAAAITELQREGQLLDRYIAAGKAEYESKIIPAEAEMMAFYEQDDVCRRRFEARCEERDELQVSFSQIKAKYWPKGRPSHMYEKGLEGFADMHMAGVTHERERLVKWEVSLLMKKKFDFHDADATSRRRFDAFLAKRSAPP